MTKRQYKGHNNFSSRYSLINNNNNNNNNNNSITWNKLRTYITHKHAEQFLMA
jgi:hypothetical protein